MDGAMTAVIITLSAFLIIFIGILLNYRRQVKKICRRLAFIIENESNALLENAYSFKEMKELSDIVNGVLIDCRENRIKYHRKDKNIKETITGLSHDIRTPLTSLDGYFQLLEQASDAEEKEHYDLIIQNRIRDLSDMLEELFTFAKLQNDVYEFESKECCINTILCDTLLGFYDDFTRAGITPDINIPDDSFISICSESALKRIFHNIIKNVLVHGCESFTVSLNTENGFNIILFKNKCMDAEKIDVEHVFDRFYKADKARSETSTGLGLAIAKELTEKTGGTIRASIDDGFIIELYFGCVEVSKGKKICL